VTPHPVEVVRVAPTPTLVVRAETTWQDFPALWRPMLDQVWARLRAHGVTSGCRNVMLYLDEVPHVEVGVVLPSLVAGVPEHLAGDDVVVSALPGGGIARTTHVGGYAGLGRAHDAVTRWVALNGENVAGPRWEVYGPHDDDEAKVWTDVCYLLAEPSGGAS
jgi:effector-binding domain-containing protein